MPQVYTYIIEGTTPSQNKLLNMHWSVRNRLKDEWYWLVRSVAGQTKNTNPTKFTITRVARGILDEDNFHAGCKYLIDAFVFYGHAVDDSPTWASFSFRQRRCNKGEAPHMEVTLEY